MSAYSQVCIVVLLAVFCHAQAPDPSHHHKKLANRGFGSETRCSWKCTVIGSNLTKDIRNTIAKGGLIHLVVKYEKKVNDKCLNQTSRNSSGNATEHLQIWMANKQRSTLVKVVEGLSNLMFDVDSNEEHREIRASCALKPANTTAHYIYSVSLPVVLSRGHLADLGVTSDSIDCSTEVKNDGKRCLNITESTGNSTTSSSSEGTTFKLNGWPPLFFASLCFVFSVVFVYYSPAIVCLFSPTEITSGGVREIVLEGESPVSFGSVMGNYFFSKNDTIWHRARMFILRAVVLPFPFLGPAIFADYLLPESFFEFLKFKIPVFGVSHLLEPTMFVYWGCYYIFAFYTSFFSTRSSKPNRPCFSCKLLEEKSLILCTCRQMLPKQIINHLRLQPLLLVKCWRAFIWCHLEYFKLSYLLLPSSCKICPIFFLRLFCFIVFLSTIPVVTVVLLIATLLAVLCAILLTSPNAILCYTGLKMNVYSRNRFLLLFLLFVHILVVILAVLGAIVLLMWASFGVLMIIVLVFVLLFSGESLPFVACFVLVLYYMWNSYSSFTNRYQDLALSLYKHHKISRHGQGTDVTSNTDSPKFADSKDNMIKIPKELFYMACEELMPIREGVCILILKITIILSFVFLVFSLIMMLDVGATPVMKALVTFLTGSLPKIVAIYIDGRRKRKIEAMATEEKIPKIVEEYINGTFGANQGQENSTADSDANQGQENHAADSDANQGQENHAADSDANQGQENHAADSDGVVLINVDG